MCCKPALGDNVAGGGLGDCSGQVLGHAWFTLGMKSAWSVIPAAAVSVPLGMKSAWSVIPAAAVSMPLCPPPPLLSSAFLLVQHGWHISDGYIVFAHPDAANNAAGKDEPAMKLINNALVYAKELERIV